MHYLFCPIVDVSGGK